jgi:CheY-like chemotaxis protein
MNNNPSRKQFDETTALETFSSDDLNPADMAKLRTLAYLVVDGDPQIRVAVAERLRAFGARVVFEADSAGRALVEVGKGAADVLLVGDGLPDMIGSDLAWCIRRSRNERERKMPVIPIGDSPEALSALHLRIFQEIYAPSPVSELPAQGGFGLH